MQCNVLLTAFTCIDVLGCSQHTLALFTDDRTHAHTVALVETCFIPFHWRLHWLQSVHSMPLLFSQLLLLLIRDTLDFTLNNNISRLFFTQLVGTFYN